MGLRVSVYRKAGHPARTRRNGTPPAVDLSLYHDELTVVNVDGPFEPTDDAPAVALLEGPGGDLRLFAVVETAPGEWQRFRPGHLVGPMFDGRYASSSDGRFSSAVGHYNPVPIQDRFETPEQYKALSQ